MADRLQFSGALRSQFPARYRLPAVYGACILATVASLAAYLLFGARATGNFGFPVDDAWIHLQIARHLAAGQGWTFNAGQVTAASTSPLWVMALTPLFWLPGDVTVWVKVLGSGLYLGSVLLVVNTAGLWVGDRRVGLVAGLLAATQASLVWNALSGMEGPLFAVIVLLSLRALLRVRPDSPQPAYAATAWLALAGWARPEVWSLLAVVWLYMAWRRRELDVGRWWVHGLLAAGPIAAFMLFNLALWGLPLPSTWYAKAASMHGPQSLSVGYLFSLSQRVVYNVYEAIGSQNLLLLLGVGLGVLKILQRGGWAAKRVVLVVALVLMVCIVTAATNTGKLSFLNYRRTTHILYLMNMLVALGAVALWDAWWSLTVPAGWQRVAGVVLGGLLVLGVQISTVRIYAGAFGNDLRSIYQGDVLAARWLATNTPPDAYVAANDIGAMAYFGGRRIFDMIGLVSPESIPVMQQTVPLAPERSLRMKALLLQQHVDYVVMFPTWFPTLDQDPMLLPLQRFPVPGATSLSGEEVVVYKFERH